MAKFAVQGTAVINKIKVSAAAQKQLRNLVVSVDTTQITNQLKNIRTQLSAAFAPLQRLQRSGGGLNNVARGLRNIQNAAQGANKAVKKQEALLLQVIRKASAFRVSTIAINSFFNTISNGLRFLIDFDSRLRNINKILRLTDSDLTNLGDRLIQVAKDFNLSAEEVADAAKTAAQAGIAGIDATQAEKTAATLLLVNKAAIAAASSTLEFGQAVEALLTIQKQLSITTEEAAVVLSKFDAIEDAAAVNAQALTVVFQKAGTSIGLAFGDNVDKATGAIAALLERTRQTPQIVGTFFKTLSARLSGANKDAIEAIRTAGQGVNLTDSFGNLRDPIELLRDLQVELKGLSDIEVGSILGKVFGIRQAELGKALLATLEEGGRAAELAAEAQGSYLTQVLKVEQEQDKFAAQLNRVTQGFNQFVNALRDDVFKPFINFLSEAGEGLNNFLGGVNNVSTGVGALLSTLAIFGTGKIGQFLTKGAAGGGLFAGLLGIGGGGGPAGKTRLSGAGQRQLFAGIANSSSRAAGPSLGRRGLKAAQKNLRAFSLGAFAASTALSVLTEKTVENAEGQGALIEAGAGAADSFAQFLVFGPKVALLAGAVSLASSYVKEYALRQKALAGDLEAASAILKRFGDNAGAAAIDRQLRGRAISQDAGGAAGAGLATQFSALIEDIRTGIRDEARQVIAPTEFEKQFATAEQRVKSFNEALSDETFEALAKFRETAPGAVEALEGVQGGASVLFKEGFLKNFDKATAETLKGLAVALSRREGRSTVAQVPIQEVAEEFAKLKETTAQLDAAFRDGDFSLAEDPSLVAVRNREREANQALAASVETLLAAEVKLFATRTGTALQATRALTFLEEERARNALKVAKSERELIKEQEKRSIVQKRQSLLARIAAGEELRDGPGAGLVDLPNLKKELADANNELAKTNQELAEFEGAVNTLEKVKAATQTVISKELALAQVRLQSLADVLSAEEASGEKRIKQATTLLQAQEGLEAARQRLENFNSNADATVGTQQVLDAVRVKNAIEIEGINQQIELQKRLQSQAVAARVDVEKTLARLSEELKSTPAGSGQEQLQAQIEETQRLLEIRAGIEQENNEKTLDLINKKAVAEIQGQTKVLNATLANKRAEEQLSRERLDGAISLLKVSRRLKDSIQDIFESQLGLSNAIRDRLAEAANVIKSRRGDLSSAYDELAGARESLISALQGGADAQAQYTLGVERASVAADKILGKFFGIRDEAEALSRAFDGTIESARLAGASEQKLSELRAEAASQQLQLYEQLLSETQSKAEQFFTSSAEDRQEFVRGLASIQQVVGQFGGNIENFRNLDEGQLNEFGSQLISLPQEIRQGMISALGQLPDGVGIGGLTADQIKEILLSGALGESEEVGIERLSDTMETVADLTRQVAEAQVAQLQAQRESAAAAAAEVAEAKERVAIAKNMLAQARKDAAGIQQGIREVTATINSQISAYRDEYKTETQALATKIKDPLERQVALQNKQVEFLGRVSEILGGAASQVGSVNADSRVVRQTERLVGPVTSGPGADVLNTIQREVAKANKELAQEISGLRQTLGGDFATSTGQVVTATSNLAERLTQIGSDGIQQNVNADIKIDNQQNIRIEGVAETVSAVISAIEARGFITPEQLEPLRAQIDELIRQGIENGDLRGSAALQR